MDSAGRVYVVGETESYDFPTTVGALQPKLAGYQDFFVARLDADGSALGYATYLGGSSEEVVSTYSGGIAVDSTGRAYVSVTTGTNDIPITIGAMQPSLAGGGDAFVARLNATGTALEYATYLGGSDYDYGYDLGNGSKTS